ncbi:hypothetical protein MACK_003579 [Theileria orientalis]|uniref:Uncharacterized protein n=1 Tax=Theileria orientalis TaxID=68886 RepID=A0A976SJG2_THEOR|nr:hypothetical protein MACK_003579 [Theileria orientalis]
MKTNDAFSREFKAELTKNTSKSEEIGNKYIRSAKYILFLMNRTNLSPVNFFSYSYLEDFILQVRLISTNIILQIKVRNNQKSAILFNFLNSVYIRFKTNDFIWQFTTK